MGEVDESREERDEAQTTVYCLLDYLDGSWSACTHDGAGLSGCPTCEGRWSTEVRWVVQAHRDRVGQSADLSDLRAHLETVTAERDRLHLRAQADDRLAHRLSQQIDAAARHLGAWVLALHGPHSDDTDPDALVGRAIAALLGGEE